MYSVVVKGNHTTCTLLLIKEIIQHVLCCCYGISYNNVFFIAVMGDTTTACTLLLLREILQQYVLYCC